MEQPEYTAPSVPKGQRYRHQSLRSKKIPDKIANDIIDSNRNPVAIGELGISVATSAQIITPTPKALK